MLDKTVRLLLFLEIKKNGNDLGIKECSCSKYSSIVEKTPERNDFLWDLKLSKFSTVLFWYQVEKNRFFKKNES
jgi:hypothetical protein